jgi:hypothetical protein
LGSFLSFIPLMVGIADSDENIGLYDGLMTSIFYREAALSSLLITIPSAIDVSMDIFLYLVGLSSTKLFDFGNSRSVKHISSASSVLRLSSRERMAFIIGIACVSVFTLTTPSTEYSSNALALYFSFSNFSTIVTMCPIIFFLERCTKVWTPMRTFLAILCTNIGSVLSSISYCYLTLSKEYIILNLTAAAFISAATTVFAYVSVICVVNSFRATVSAEGDNYGWSNYGYDMFFESRAGTKFYKHYVPGIYTLAIMAISASNVAWYFVQVDQVVVTAALISLQTAVAVIVFVVEIRLRQNEVLSGLVSPIHNMDVNAVRYDIACGNCKIFFNMILSIISSYRDI